MTLRSRLRRHDNFCFWALGAKHARADFSLKPVIEPQLASGQAQGIVHRARYNYNYVRDMEVPLDMGNRWGAFREQMRRRISLYPEALAAIRWAQMDSEFDNRVRVTPRSRREMELARHFLQYEYPHFADYIDQFKESPVSSATTMFDGYGPVSSVHYFHMMYVLSMLSIDTDINAVCEIGGGYGNLARLWMTNPIKPIQYYCIVDLPESLFHAECFLAAAMPDVRTYYVTSNESYAPLNGERCVLLCPIALAHNIKRYKFDVVVNTGSMAEMTDDWVAYWGRWIDEQQARYFYSHNYFGNPTGKLFEARSTFAPMMSAEWTLKHVRPMHPMMYLQSNQRKATELLFARGGRGDADETIRGLLQRRIDLHSLIVFAYAFDGAQTELACEFVSRAEVDLGYAPVEFIHIITRLLDRDDVGDARARLTSRRDELLRVHQAKFPQGTMDA